MRASLTPLVVALCLASFPAHPAVIPKQVRVLISASGTNESEVADACASLSTALASSPYILAIYVSGSDGSENGASPGDQCRLFVDLDLASANEIETTMWQIRSLPAGPVLARGEVTRSASSADWTEASYWLPLVDSIPEALAAVPPDTIIVRAKPGTQISGIGNDFSMPPNGEIELPIEIPALYSWRARIPGAYPEYGSIYVKEGGTSLDIPYKPLVPGEHWSFDTSLYSFTFPELRASFSPAASWFARATITQFLFGLSLPNGGGSYPSLIYSTGLLQSGLGMGWYPLGRKRNLQAYFALDCFARLILPDGGGIKLEPIAPIGISPIVGLEWSQAGDVGIFVETGATIYPIANPEYMFASAGGDNSGMLLFGGGSFFSGHPGWFGEFPDARFGLRFKL